jgi:hypothetical protein
MRFRTTLILLLVVALLGAYLWYVDRGRPSTAEQHLVEKRIFKTFDQDKVAALRVVVAYRTNEIGAITNREEFVVVRDVAGWNVTAPVNFPADEAKIGAILDQVKRLEQQRVTTPEEYARLNRAEAGLEEPDIVADFDMLDTNFSLHIGFEVPSLWNVYVAVPGRKEAYFAPHEFKDKLRLTTDSGDNDVRRRAVFGLRPYQVNAVQLERPDGALELQRDNDSTWRVTQPLRDAADHKQIETLLGQLEKLRVETFCDAPTSFGTPRLTLTVVQGTTSQRLQLGDEVSGPDDYEDEQGVRPKSLYLARRGEYPQYFTVKKSEVAGLLRPRDAYRDMRLFVTYDYHDPHGMTQVVGDNTLDLVRDPDWRVSGVASPLVDATKVDDYVYGWLDLPITNFADAAAARAALSNVWIRLAVPCKDIGQPLELALSAPRGPWCYAERSPGVFVAVARAAVAAHLATNEMPFLTNELLDVPAERVCAVDISTPEWSGRLAKSTNQWVLICSNAVTTLKDDIEVTLGTVLPVPVARWVAKVSPAGLAQYGLTTPAQRYAVEVERGDYAELCIGAAAPDGEGFYAMLAGQPYVGIISADALDKLSDALSAVR